MGGIILSVRLTPNADRDAVTGCKGGPEGTILLARVRAVPEKGKANKALIKLLSKLFDISQSEIEIKSGHKSRIKIVRVNGDIEQINNRLSELLIS